MLIAIVNSPDFCFLFYLCHLIFFWRILLVFISVERELELNNCHFSYRMMS
jgi:hypothetical protein